MNIAVLGATGYIGRSLVAEFSARGISVTAYTRDKKRAAEVFTTHQIESTPQSYEKFGDEAYDIVINATGIGSRSKLSTDPAEIFGVTEEGDAYVASYLEKYPNTQVVNFSSGAAYGRAVGKMVGEETRAEFPLNLLEPSDFYGLAKLNAEAKHRAMSAGIIDLRVFTFFSRYVSLDETFFLSDLARAILQKDMLETGPSSMVRDCMITSDLADAILFLSKGEPQNDVFDLVSKAPFEKFELLDVCAKEFGLMWQTKELTSGNPTGEKNIYASNSTKLAERGFTPTYTSTEGILTELRALLELRN